VSLDIGELVGYIRLDHKGVAQGIQGAQRDVQAGMQSVTNEAAKGGQKAGTEAGNRLHKAFGSGVTKLAGLVAGAFVVDKAVRFLGDVKTAASDLNETTSASSVIFGKNAAAVQAWAKTSDRSFGLSEQAALDAATSFGDMFQQIGYTGDAATSASKQVVQMAADLGSFKNLGTDDVLDRISGALRGEYDSLQLVIPNINAARVQTVAMTETGKKSADQLTAQEKAHATLSIIQKDGARAMGDFARTANGAANSEKIAAAQTENLKAKIGQQLLPAYIAVVSFGNEKFLPFLSSSIDHVIDFAHSLGPVVDALGAVASGFVGLPGPVQAAIVGLLAFVALKPKIEAVGTSMKTRVASGGQSLASTMETVRLHMLYAGDASATATGKFTGAAKAIGYGAGVGLRGAASGLLSVLGGPWGIALAAAAGAVGYWAKKQADAKQRVKELTAAIEADSGALGKNTRASVANALETSGAAKSAKELGVNLKDLTDASLGNAAAQERVAAAIAASKAETVESVQGNINAADSLDAWQKQADKVTDAIHGQRGEVADARAEAQRHAEMLGTDAAASSDLADATKDTTGALQGQATAAKEATDKIGDLADKQMTATDANIAYEQAVDDVSAALKENGKTANKTRTGLDLTTEAGRNNQQALNDLASAARDQAKSNIENGASINGVRSAMDEARGRFIDNAVRMGVSKTAAEKMADKFGLSKKGVDSLASSLGTLPASKQVKVEAETAAAKQKIEDLKTALAGIKNKSVVVTATQRFVNNSAGPGRATGGGSTFDNEHGGVYYFAQGGSIGSENHLPQIAYGDGPTRIWREKPTMGETYIPHNPRDRVAAERMLMQTARDFGMLGGGGGAPQVVVYPQPGQSEYEIGVHAGNALALQMRKP
jgi:hypothetical protein